MIYFIRSFLFDEIVKYEEIRKEFASSYLTFVLLYLYLHLSLWNFILKQFVSKQMKGGKELLKIWM